MKQTLHRVPIWTAGAAIAAGLVVASPATAAFACGEEPLLRPAATVVPWTAVTAGALPIQVTGPGPVTLPAGGRTPVTVTVANAGRGIAGSIALEVRADGPGLFPALTVELAGTGTTWRRLAEEGTAGARWYVADRLTFQAGEMSTGFRLRVPAETPPGQRLRVVAHVRDTAERGIGTTTFRVTVTDPPLQVRSTFPDELRRGDGYREFDLVVHNPSERTYHRVSTGLSMTGLTGTPVTRAAGSLTVADIRLERRTGGSWHRLAVHPGCDPTPWAQLTEPFDLAAGDSRVLHLRIRLADSPATKPHPALYSLGAFPAGLADAQASIDGSFRILPRQAGSRVTHRPAPAPAPTSARPAVDPVPSTPTPTATPEPAAAPAAAPATLPHTGTGLWPLAGSLVFVLGGAGILLAVRGRRARRA